jgi:hypothetical protein
MDVYKTYFEGVGMEKLPQPTEEAVLQLVENFILRNKLTPTIS